jgi:glycosyltransferase involved in cell wall biosynthesis
MNMIRRRKGEVQKELRILVVSHSASCFVNAIVKHLAKNGCIVTYLAPIDNEIPLKLFRALGVRFVPLNVTSTLGKKGLLNQRRLLRRPNLEVLNYVVTVLSNVLILSTEVDVILAQWVLPMGFLCGSVGSILRKPVVIIVHGASVYLNPEVGFYVPTYSYARLALRLSFIFAQKLIAISNDTKTHLLQRGAPNDKIEVVYNGVDHLKFDPSVSGEKVCSKMGLKKSFVLLTVRNLVKRKGVHYLIEAMPCILEQFPNTKLLIIGDGPFRPRLESLASKLGLVENVFFLGHIPNDKTPPYYAACDIFVMPSLDEGFGISVVEAMAMKKPIVSTNAGGLKEVVDDKTAIVVPPANSPLLARAVIKLLKNPVLRKQMGKNGRKKVEKTFNWDRAVLEYISICRSVMRQ